MANTLANEAHQRSLKDFLTLYNVITEYCFSKCVSNFNERRASTNETSCVDTCTDNYVQYNQRFMFNFVDHQERRKKDQERLAVEEAAKAAQAAQTEQVTPAQEQQIQKATELLENLSSASSPSFNSSSVDGATVHASSPLVESLKASSLVSADAANVAASSPYVDPLKGNSLAAADVNNSGQSREVASS